MADEKLVLRLRHITTPVTYSTVTLTEKDAEAIVDYDVLVGYDEDGEAVWMNGPELFSHYKRLLRG